MVTRSRGWNEVRGVRALGEELRFGRVGTDTSEELAFQKSHKEEDITESQGHSGTGGLMCWADRCVERPAWGREGQVRGSAPMPHPPLSGSLRGAAAFSL